MNFKKTLSLFLSLIVILSLFVGCKTENALKEGGGKSSKTSDTSSAPELIIPLDISLKRSDAVAFAGLIANNNAGKTEGEYYINYRADAKEISQKLENNEADVGVLPFSDAIKLCGDNSEMRIVGVNFASDIFAISEKEISSLDDFKKASVLVIKNGGIDKNTIDFPKNAEVEYANDSEDTRLLAKSGLYDAVIAPCSLANHYKGEELSVVSDIGALAQDLRGFALVAKYETVLGNVKGFERLEKELVNSAKALDSKVISELYILSDTEEADFIAENLTFDIRFFEDCKAALGEFITEENQTFFKIDK